MLVATLLPTLQLHLYLATTWVCKNGTLLNLVRHVNLAPVIAVVFLVRATQRQVLARRIQIAAKAVNRI